MNQNGGEQGAFRDHRMLILDALKRHEQEIHDLREKQSQIQVSAARQGAWGSLGGAFIVALKELGGFFFGGP